MEFENYNLANGSGQIIEIVYQNDKIDLHNACEFVGLEYHIKSTIISLHWKYYINYNESDIKHFQLVFGSVQSIKISPRDEEMPHVEDESLKEIICNDESIVFWLMSDMAVEITAANTRLEMDHHSFKFAT